MRSNKGTLGKILGGRTLGGRGGLKTAPISSIVGAEKNEGRQIFMSGGAQLHWGPLCRFSRLITDPMGFQSSDGPREPVGRNREVMARQRRKLCLEGAG